MKSDEFDSLIKDSLKSVSPSPQTRKAITEAIERKQKTRVFIRRAVSAASSAAAVFICAVAVMNGFDAYNTEKKAAEADIAEVKTEITVKKNLPDTIAEDNAEKETAAESTAPESTVPKPRVKKRSAEGAEKKEAPAAAAKEEAASSEGSANGTVKTSEEAEDTFTQLEDAANSRISEEPADAGIAAASLYSAPTGTEDTGEAPLCASVGMTGGLFTLFNEDFDYKTAITEKINAQSPPESFDGISGYESYYFSPSGALVITIYDEDGKEYNFEVGYIENGELKG